MSGSSLRDAVDVMALAARVKAGDPRAVSRLISLIENHDVNGTAVLDRLEGPALHAEVTGVAPGLGDDVQAMKAGLLEVAQIVVVNKADREGAESAAADLKEWVPRLVRTVAVKGEGIPELIEAIAEHQRIVDLQGKRS